MARMRAGLQIGDLAGRCGVSRDTIRFYERKGLLPRPHRTPSQYRIYGDDDEGRILFIRKAQALGLTLDDIRQLVRQEQLRTPGQCRRVASLLRERIEALDQKIAEFKAFRRQLAKSLEQCDEAGSEACPVVLNLGGYGTGMISRSGGSRAPTGFLATSKARGREPRRGRS